MSEKKAITRREFIKDTSAAALGGALLLGLPGVSAAKGAGKSDVALVRDKDVLDKNGAPVDEVVLKMLDAAVAALSGEKDPVKAWKTFIRPTDIVGIKTNIWPYLPTTTQVEKAIKQRILDAGVKEENIGIKDRGLYRDELFGKATALINARPMRTHHWSGVGSCLKNLITFVPRPDKYHPDSCADLAKLWQLPLTKGKVRLNILVMLTPQFHGIGPHSFNPKYVWNYYGFIVGVDPVAVDATGVRIIQAKRREYFAEDRPLNPPPKHIFLADTRHHLGTADPAKINLIKLGYSEGIFL